jgi:DNA-damage-inducible protein J
MTDCIVRSRIDPLIKAQADQLFEHMGLTLSEAIRLFLYQSVAEKRIPFYISMPNEKTREVLKQCEHGQNISITSLEQLNNDWDKACDK